MLGPQCDEQRPTCGRCARRKTTCSLQASTPQGLPTTTTTKANRRCDGPSTPPGSTPSPCAGLAAAATTPTTPLAAPDPDAGFSVEDMSLLHHFLRSTVATFSSRARTIEASRDAIPAIAFADPPVLHSVLAIAALHRAHEPPPAPSSSSSFSPSSSPSSQQQSDDNAPSPLWRPQRTRRHHVAKALAHQDIVLRALRQRVGGSSTAITPATAPGAFIMSSYLAIFALGAMHRLVDEGTEDAAAAAGGGGDDGTATLNFSSPAEWVRLIRGVPSILRQDGVWAWVLRSPAGALLGHGGREDWPLPANLKGRFATLRHALAADDGGGSAAAAAGGVAASGEEARVYAGALDLLERWTANAHAPAGEVDLVGVVLVWVNVVEDRYVELLCENRPGALVLLAQWAVLVHRLDAFWWAKGWGPGLIRIVWKLLPERWRPLIEEPANEVGCPIESLAGHCAV